MSFPVVLGKLDCNVPHPTRSPMDENSITRLDISTV